MKFSQAPLENCIIQSQGERGCPHVLGAGKQNKMGTCL